MTVILFLYLYLIQYVILIDSAAVFSQKHFKPIRGNDIRIAVIGTGIGGSSFIYYFNKLYKNNQYKYPLTIDIYDKNNIIGGRIKSININNNIIEIGASIAIKENKYIYNLVNELNLTHIFPSKLTENKDNKFAIFNSNKKEFSFISYSSNSWLNIPYSLYYFGIKKLYNLLKLSKSFTMSINKMYQYQNNSLYKIIHCF